ncbi:MAG TPA: HAD hydrolase family protein [Candidatus Ratteibacteria bacterium]|nr:HAD hydrolase family protein [Candidatus Ratteibacteria bacterium]
MELSIKNIKIFISDVDGVMTDGGLFYINDCLYRKFNVKDGIGIKMLKIVGIEIAILSSNVSVQTKNRFLSLGVNLYFEGIKEKDKFIEGFLKENNLQWDNVCYMGDDLQDIKPIRKASFSICPSDAVEEIKEIVNYVCKRKGGEGAFREGVEKLTKKIGKWEKIKKEYLL